MLHQILDEAHYEHLNDDTWAAWHPSCPDAVGVINSRPKM